MHLIVDSGSTKTIWCLVDKDQLIQEITTTGMNPYISSGEMIQAIVELEVVSQLSSISSNQLDIKLIFSITSANFSSPNFNLIS